MQGVGGTWLLGTSSAPCVWVCDYPRQLSAGQDSLVYIAEGNENILTRRCLLGVQCLVGAGERCLTLSGEGNSYRDAGLTGFQAPQKCLTLDTSTKTKATKTQSLRARCEGTCLMSWLWRDNASFAYLVISCPKTKQNKTK